MKTISAHGRKAVETQPQSRPFGPLCAFASAVALAAGLTPALAPEAAAQSRSGIFINKDVLNSLGPGPTAPLSPRSQPVYPAPMGQPYGETVNLGFQPYGNDSFVVTRPGTLLFPPLHEPHSTLTPGFAGAAGHQDAQNNAAQNHAARARALDNAFAEGPEPRSQLLIPLESPSANSSVMVFMDNLPPANPNADPTDAPVLVLRQPPRPAPRKPAVPDEVLAALQQPASEAPAALAPEFAAPEFAAPELAASELAASEPPIQQAPEMAALPPEAPIEPQPLTAAEASAPESAAPGTAAPEAVIAETVAAEAPVAEAAVAEAAVADPALDEAPAPDAAAAMAAPMADPITIAEMPAADDAPVSLLPAAQTSDSDGGDAPRAPSGLQTASLTIGRVEDMSFLFEVDSAELSPEVESELRGLASALRGDAGSEIQVLGFASDQDGAGDQARRLALSRALKVRSFLIDAGIPSTRIRVRSLGDRAEGGPANRVDIRPIGS